MTLPTIDRSIRLRVMFLMIATTFVALLVTAISLVLYDISYYRNAWLSDLTTQANLVGRASAPALAFDDSAAAAKNLELLAVRPRIVAAALYARQGGLVARYVRPDEDFAPFPSGAPADGYRIQNARVWMVQPVSDPTGRVGTVYIEAKYELSRRVWSYLAIIGMVLALSLLVAGVLSYRLQATFTGPLLAMTDVSHQVQSKRDYSLRVKKTTRDEIGDLVDTFNGMLEEVGQRTRALEESNRSLQHEMTVRHEAEQALRAADQRKDEFLATLAHELRNPLAPIRNALELLRRRPDDPEVSGTAREIMERQLRQLVRLVDDLLDVSRITRGSLTLRREPVALERVIQNALDVAQPLIEGRGQRFIVSLPGHPVVLDADLARLSQAILNLLDNAAKFTPQGGTVSLEAREEEGALVLAIADNGVGIPREKLPEIFEMFAQLDRTHERPYSGLGVGLSLARRLVELHGGTLAAESQGAGRGSRFTIRLPVLPAPAADGFAPARDESEPPAGGDEARSNGAAGRATALDPLSSSHVEAEPTERKPGGASP